MSKSEKRKKAERPNVGIGYGAYYEDMLPIDAEELKAIKTQNNVWIKIGLLTFAVSLAIAACVVVMLMV